MSRAQPTSMKQTSKAAKTRRWSDLVVIFAGAYLVIGGAVSLLGWILDIPRLTEWFATSGISIQPNTCVAVIFTGLGVIALRSGINAFAIICGLVSLLTASSSWFQNLTGIDLGVDQMLTFGREWGFTGALYPGRMGIPSAAAWSLTGIGIVLAGCSCYLTDTRRRYLQRIASALALPVMAISLLSLIGYIFNAQDLYTIPRLTVISFQTSTFVFAAAIALIAALPGVGTMRLLNDDGPAGMIARRVTPAIFVICIGLGFIRLLGERAGLYDAAFGTAGRTLIEMALLLIMLGWAANAVKRAHSKAKLLEGHRDFAFAIADKIRNARHPQPLLAEISTALGEHLGLHRCLFNEIDLTADIERVFGDYSRSGESVSGVHKVSSYSSASSKEMAEGHTVVNRDSAVDPRTKELFQTVYGPSKEIAYVAVPMLREGQWVASLWCSDDEPRDWTEEDISLIENIAERTWAAIERLRSEEASRHRDEQKAFLLELSDAIRPLDDPHEIRFTAARLLAAHLGVDSVIATAADATSTVTRDSITSQESPFIPRFDLTSTYVQQFALESGPAPVAVDDVEVDPRLSSAQRRELDELGVAAFAGVWRNGSGEHSLAVHIHSGKPREWTQRELELLNEATDRIRSECSRAEASRAVRRSEAALREREAELARVQRIGSVGGVYIDLQDGMRGVRSPEYRRLHGLPDDVVEETQEQWLSRVHPDDRETVEQGLADTLLSDAKNYVNEYRIIRPDNGEVRWISAITDIERDDEGKPVRLIGAHIDVTERRRTEDALRESEQRLRLVQAAGGIGSIDYDLNRNEAVCSPEFYRLLGVANGTPVGREIWESIIHPDDRGRVVGILDDAIELRKNIDHDFRIVRQNDNSVRWLSWRAALILDAEGSPWRYVGGMIDITDRKLAEQAMIDATVKFESVFNQSGIFAGIMDLNGVLLEVNDLALSACGYTREEVLNKPFWATAWWRKSRQIQARVRKAVEEAQQGHVFREELPFWFADGTERVTDFSLHAIRDANGEITYLHSTGIDITERRVAERGLVDSELRSRVILESISDSFIALDRKWRFTYVNAEAGRTLDREPAELLGKSLWNELPGLKGSTIERVLRRTLSSGRAESITDYYPDHDRWYEMHAYPQVDGLSLYFRNVTEEKRAEEERRAIDARYRNLFDSIDQGFCTLRVLFDLDGAAVDYEIIEVNPAFPNVTGLKNVVGKRGTDIPKLGPEWIGIFGRVARSSKAERFEHHVGGVDRWFSVHVYRIDERIDNQVAVLFEDITQRKASELERKLAAEALTASEARFRLAQQTGRVGIWDWDIAAGHTYWSEQMWSLYDIDSPCDDPDADLWSGKLHLDDRDRAVRRFRENLESGATEHSDSYRIHCSDGSVRWLESIATIERDADGNAIRMYGVNLDVTALRQANDELESRVAERTQELAAANLRLVEQMEAQATFEAQRIELLKRIFTVQEEERGRIARDLHDQLGQRLTALRLKIASLKELCAGNPAISQRIERLDELSEMLDREVSFLVWELRPAVLDKADFVPALQQYVTEWSRHSEISAEFEAVGLDDVDVHADIENNFYRITQEALNNTAKYADATKVSVLIERRQNNLMLIVEDNGIGFDVSRTMSDGGGFGLIGMRERASLIAGSLEIESSPGSGTTVFVRVPLAD